MSTSSTDGKPVNRDAEHLRLLYIFHYVGAGLLGLGSLLQIIQIALASIMFKEDPFNQGYSLREIHFVEMINYY